MSLMCPLMMGSLDVHTLQHASSDAHAAMPSTLVQGLRERLVQRGETQIFTPRKQGRERQPRAPDWAFLSLLSHGSLLGRRVTGRALTHLNTH